MSSAPIVSGSRLEMRISVSISSSALADAEPRREL